MGLLTDPNGGQGKLTKFLLKFHSKLTVLLYIAGVVWFCAMASPMFNAGTYFSENALLPGLVKSLFYEDQATTQLYRELQDEAQKYDNSIPYPWLLAKFQQIGLDAYTHNFTLHSPLNSKETYYGKNVYGILRAPRASSTEALVLSAPYRSTGGIYPSTLPSIVVQLAFAKYAIKEKYWAKDIIFLITDHEQLGMQAWLEAYYGVTCGNENVLDHGKLKGRAGAIQAAINLELHSRSIGYVDLKIEGLNGQLPNLDLFNLAGKICGKEGVSHTFKGQIPEYHADPYKEWFYYFKNMLSMVATQTTGIPNGNHGLFLRFGVQALTLEGFEEMKGGSRVGLVSIGRVIEGIFRSMNNLLERFHQSFFFYLLPSYDRYISIGLYMPAVCLVAAALLIKACAKWYKMQERQNDENNHNININYIKVAVLFVILHGIGALTMAFPEFAGLLPKILDTDSGTEIFCGLLVIVILSLFAPVILRDVKKSPDSMELFNIIALLELGTTIICLSMNNISLGFFCGIISVPVALLIGPTSSKLYLTVQKLLWVLTHPLLVIFIVVLVNTYSMFSQENTKEILFRAFSATHQAVIYSIVDSMIYGNWLYTVVTTVLIPNWLCFWYVTFSENTNLELTKKNN